MVRAVFLDRDGVINANLERDGKPVAPTTLAEFRIFPDIEAAVRRLKDAGFLLVIVDQSARRCHRADAASDHGGDARENPRG